MECQCCLTGTTNGGRTNATGAPAKAPWEYGERSDTRG